jgi:hypothetical protein
VYKKSGVYNADRENISVQENYVFWINVHFKKNVFFYNCDERQLYWASSKGIRGNIRKIWNFFSEIFSISFLSFVWDAVYNWHIKKGFQLFYYIDHSWELLTLKIAYKHVSLWLRIDQVCDLLIYYIDI